MVIGIRSRLVLYGAVRHISFMLCQTRSYHVNFEIPYNCAYTPPAPTKYTIVSVAPVIILHSNTCTYFGKKLRWLVETFVDGEHIIRDEKFNEK